MIRAKKFSNIKNKPLFRFLREVDINYDDVVSDKMESLGFYTYYFQLYFTEDFSTSIIRSKVFVYNNESIEYTINREETTGTWMLVCDKLIVMDIRKNDIEEFTLSYLFSPLYNFVVYEYNSGYVIICVSHTRDEIGDVDYLMRFQLINNSKPRYVLLSQFIRPELSESGGSGFVVLNKNIKDYLLDDVKSNDCLYKFYNNVGYGVVKDELLEFTKIIVKYTDAFKNYPLSYLSI